MPSTAMRWMPPVALAILQAFAAGGEQAGIAIYREHCQRCHGEGGKGTPDVPQPLVGELSVAQLTRSIDETMPEDDPKKVVGDDARRVAEYIHESFYSAVARDRNRPAREDLSRLTVRQFENTIADLVGSFRSRGPGIDVSRGLRAEYFHRRDFNRELGLVYEQVDPTIDFDFGIEGPDPERFEPNRFSIRWTGSIVPPETGVYEFVVRSGHGVKLRLNDEPPDRPLVDAWVKSGDTIEHRGARRLLGGRAYPLTLEFSKANLGVDDKKHEPPAQASIQLLWKPPHGVLEVVPSHRLIPQRAPPTFVVATPFPPDDRSIGYERGSAVSKEWFAAATAAAAETADHVRHRLEQLARVNRDAPDRGEKLRAFAKTFVERAFRRPLDAAAKQVYLERPFADAPDADTGLERAILLCLSSPRFLFREPAGPADGFATAARLSFALWDSIPDPPLLEAAAENRLAKPDEIRRQAERMIADRRTRSKLRDFLFGWLRVDHGPELVKDATRFSEFSPELSAELRSSLELFLEDAIWRDGGDWRRLFLDDEVPVNGRLAALYGPSLPFDAGFRRVRLDDGRRAGVLTHPYLMSVLAYSGATSPIHRGVFLARNVLGNVLKPPQEAVAPLSPDLHPLLSTRERVELQTSAVACQTCHTMINPLGFALEEFDAIGRHRTTELLGETKKPIDASGSYQPREGDEATFRGARELATYLVGSQDAQEAFVQSLFHAIVKQPVRAWGPEALATLRAGFVAGSFDIRRLVVDIMVMAASPPPGSVP